MRRTVPAAAPPGGLLYLEEFLTAADEQALIAEIETYEYQQVVMHGTPARRTVLHFGWDYDYDGWRIFPATPPPQLIRALADRCAPRAGVAAAELEQFLVARYPPGATIGWHRDAPMFGEPVLGISLGSACTMKFRRRLGDSFESWATELAPRSLYALAGPARTEWQHSIPPTRALRYSITMRTLRRKPAERK